MTTGTAEGGSPLTAPDLPATALRRYAFALLVTSAALAVTVFARDYLPHTIFIFGFAAVALSAWYGGLGPGALSSAISIIGVDYLVLPPSGEFKINHPGEAVAVGTFLIVSLVISSLSESMRKARVQAELENIRFRQAESDLRASEARSRLFAEASAALASSLDTATALRALAGHVAHSMSDLSVAHLVEADGQLRAVGVETANPDLARVLSDRSLLRRLAPGGSEWWACVLRTGDVLHLPELDGGLPSEAASPGDRGGSAGARLRANSAIVVPLRARERIVGLLTAITVDGGRGALGAADRDILEELAIQAKLSLENALLFESEQEARMAAELAAERTLRLQKVTSALSRVLPQAEVLEVIVSEGVSALGGFAGAVAELTPDGRNFFLLHSVGYGGAILRDFQLFPASLGVPTADVVRTGDAVLVETVEEWKRRYGPLPNRDAGPVADGAWAALPLKVQDRLFGVLTLSFEHSRRFSSEERDFMLALANQCAQALERSRLFEAEARARADAEEANRAKTAFLSTMSHELRTPLNAIAGYVELVQMGIHGPVTDQQAGALDRVAENQRLLLALITDILNFARLEAGKIEYRMTDIAVDELLAGIPAMIEPLLASRELRCEYQAPPGDVALHGDRHKVQQIVLNLLGNAIKFTLPGGRVRLFCETTSHQIRINVQDTGRGIPPEKLDAIFDPFFQVDRKSGDSQQGVGLGLSISRDLARGMRGEITVRSVEGEGSIFTLVLPRASMQQPQQPRAEPV